MLFRYEESPAFESGKIILRPLCEEDMPRIMRLFEYPLDEEKAHRLITRSHLAFETGEEMIFGVIAKADGQLKGIIETYPETDGRLFIGYRTMPEERHRGYASEAVYVLVHAMVRQGVSAVYAAAEETNEDSLAILRHGGFEEKEKKDGKILYAYYRNPQRKEKTVMNEGEKTIYCAAGCFWGSEKAFKLLEGVTATETGYANGTISNPRYEDVCRGNTGFRETVKIIYDPEIISLETIMEAYFLCIDPTVANRQGNDAGTQYQTGVYYTDPEDEEILKAVFAEEKKKYSVFAAELEPLKNFYTAEEYHQNYLEKNPGGYCHITRYEFEKVKALNKKRKK